MEKTNLNFDSLFLLDIKGTDYFKKEMSFPFKVALSFRKLIQHIEEAAKCDNDIKKNFAQSILNEVNSTPELLDPIYDLSIAKKYEKIIGDMMTFVFPDAFWEKQTYAASIPFLLQIFYGSPRFHQVVKIYGGNIDGELNIDQESFNFGRTIGAYVAVLNKIYGMNFNFDFPLVYKIPDPETGLDRYFKLNMADEFAEVVVKGKIKEFSKEDLDSIREKLYDLDYLKEMLPSENFELHGFIAINAINISDTEILSAMKRDLIEKETVTAYSGFLKLQHALKSLLRCPGLILGISDCSSTSEIMIKNSTKFGNCFLLNECTDSCVSALKDSIYQYSYDSKKVVIIEDLNKYPNKTIIEESILKKGIKNILISPLVYGNEVVGILELGSPEPGMINMINSLKLREVLPLFAMTIARNNDETNNKIQAIIKEKCTAIHPTLEWKFRNAAINLLKKQNEGLQEEMEEIVFHDVFPLYGLSDIRNSSLQRNEVIREDLIENLTLAMDVMNKAKQYKELRVFDEVNYKIEKRIKSLKFGIDSGDEADVLRFLNKKIVPLFDHLKSYNKEVKKVIENYHSAIDKELGFVYKRRKSYEECTGLINNMIAGYLDEEQVKIQKIFPHYFERYKTDGVDHTIYMGSSLTDHKKFNKIYLKNLRLWQLIIMCAIVRKSDELKKDLSIPLETAHLILVQDSPLSIRFRYDEKKFDVDGAYNVRYEIMKKRIDKAEIKGKEERLTQPGKIAIVYSRNTEAQEYLEYIEYLQTKNYFKREVEELELEELQGVKGLKALRVTVDSNNPKLDTTVDNENIKKVIQKMSSN